MKKFLVTLAVLVIIGAAAFAAEEYIWSVNNKPYEKSHTVARQAKTSHALVFYNDSGDARKRCTGTVIGKHVVLTAVHCNEAGLQYIRMDYSGRRYKILATVKDDRDHVMYLLDGPEFLFVDPYKTRAPRIGERVYIYGFGGGAYPAEYKVGVILDEYDPSEISFVEGFFYTSIKAISGDSGSAIYGDDGAILGIVTYQLTDEGYLFNKIRSAEFTIDSKILNATMLKPVEPKPVEVRNPFDTIFGMKK